MVIRDFIRIMKLSETGLIMMVAHNSEFTKYL